LAQRGASFVPGPYGAAIRAGLKIATPILQKAGVAGYNGLGALYQAPDGTLYQQVQGLNEDEELRGLAEDEELRGLDEDDELRGIMKERAMTFRRENCAVSMRTNWLGCGGGATGFPEDEAWLMKIRYARHRWL
jgi:hypothetical protein